MKLLLTKTKLHAASISVFVSSRCGHYFSLARSPLAVDGDFSDEVAAQHGVTRCARCVRTLIGESVMRCRSCGTPVPPGHRWMSATLLEWWGECQWCYHTTALRVKENHNALPAL